MAGLAARRLAATVAVLCLAVAFSGCARWRGALQPPRAILPAFTSFDDLLPEEIASIVYLPDLPRSKRRFSETELSRRLAEQKAREVWRRVDFLRPWVAAAFEQITDQVDELAWGTYRAGSDEEWFLLARLNQPARRVLSRLHRRVLPRVAEEIHPLAMIRHRFRGRRIYEWVRHTSGAERSLVSYAMVGRTMVMGSDGGYVRGAVERRPAWPRSWWTRRTEVTTSAREQLQAVLAGLERADDLHAWFRIGENDAQWQEAALPRWRRAADRVRQIVSSHVDAVSAGLHITPPTITGRWRLGLRPSSGLSAEGAPALASPSAPRWRVRTGEPFAFHQIAPASAQSLIAIHQLPFDHPLFRELRTVIGGAAEIGPFERLRDSIRILSLVPGIGDLSKVIGSLEGKVAYCSFPAADAPSAVRPVGPSTRKSEEAGRMPAVRPDDDRAERCLMIALEDPAIVASGLRATSLLLRKLVETEEYRGRPLVRLGATVPGSDYDIAAAVVEGALVVSTRAEAMRCLVDAVESGETLDRQPVVRQLERHRTRDVMAEFYTAGNPRRPSIGENEDDAAQAGSEEAVMRLILADLPYGGLSDLVAGRSYSLCLRQPRGVEVVTCSATGFHWTSTTAGLAAIVLRSPAIANLARREAEAISSRTQGSAGSESTER